MSHNIPKIGNGLLQLIGLKLNMECENVQQTHEEFTARHFFCFIYKTTITSFSQNTEFTIKYESENMQLRCQEFSARLFFCFR